MHANPHPYSAHTHIFFGKDRGQRALEIVEWKPEHLEILFSEQSLADFFFQKTSPVVPNNGFLRCKEFVQ